MSSDLDRLARLKERQAKQKEEEAQRLAQQRATANKIRKAERALATRRATLLGETIRDAKLTPHERAVICGVIGRRHDKPADWDKISDFHLAVVSEHAEIKPSRPHAELTQVGK